MVDKLLEAAKEASRLSSQCVESLVNTARDVLQTSKDDAELIWAKEALKAYELLKIKCKEYPGELKETELISVNQLIIENPNTTYWPVEYCGLPNNKKKNGN